MGSFAIVQARPSVGIGMLMTAAMVGVASWAGAQVIPRIWPPVARRRLWRIAAASSGAFILALFVVSRLDLSDASGILDGLIMLGGACALSYVGTYWSIPKNAQLPWP
jgi:hypothetical protein